MATVFSLGVPESKFILSCVNQNPAKQVVHRIRALGPCLSHTSPRSFNRSTGGFRGSVRSIRAAADTSRVAEATSSPEEAPSGNEESAEINTGPPQSAIWELDFSSRPVLDARGKKKWELLICSPDGTWQFSKYFPNNKINSTQVCSSHDADG
jgi:hypothetical protein